MEHQHFNDVIYMGNKDDLINIINTIYFKKKLPSDIKYITTQLTDGITNQLYKVDIDKPYNISILVRIFGKHTENIINRLKEEKIVSRLSEIGFGPKIYGHFNNGRLEEYLLGTCPNPVDMYKNKHLQKYIAKELATMHQLDMSNYIDKSEQTPQLFIIIKKWLSLAKQVQFPKDEIKRLTTYQSIPLDKIELYVLQKEHELKAINDVVFAHNDLLSGNMLYNQNDNENQVIRFLDFEYGSYNYRAFDIANHFCECCGFDCDFINLFPSEQEQKVFIQEYLQYATNSKNTINELYQQIQLFIPLSHIFWGTWALVRAETNEDRLKFDYLSYGKSRFDELLRTNPNIL